MRGIRWCILGVLAGIVWAQPQPAGLIVQRRGGAYQFFPATELKVNDKDRVSVLGDKPALSAGAKLGNQKLEGVTLLLDGASGVVAQYTHGDGQLKFLYPNGIQRKNAPAPAAAWKESTFEFQKTAKDKVATTLPGSDFLAYLAGGVKELADVVMDERALGVLGGGFEARIALTEAAVAAYRNDPAMAGVEAKIAGTMRVLLGRFDAGIESAKSLEEGLRFAQLSAKAYADRPAHIELRNQLAASRAELNKRMTVLQTLAAGGMWDAFVLAYEPFEKHQDSFPEMAKLHRKALEASLQEHWTSGKERLKRGEFRRAWTELRAASRRQPSNALLRQEVSVAWAQYSRQSAVDRQNQRKNLSLGELDVIEQTRAIAERYLQQQKLDEAMEKLAEAERINAESLPVLLTKAAILGARAETRKALEILDTYDLLAVDREREAGNKLRGELMFQLTDTRDSLHKKLVSAWGQGKYFETASMAKKGLLADDNDPTILYYAGLSALATRNTEAGLGYLRRYLKVSNTLDGNQGQRESVSRWLMDSWGETPDREGSGVRHWFSGRRLAEGILYCPSSMMFSARVDHVEASNNFGLRFEWEGERLQTIKPFFDKSHAATGEKQFVFSYADGLPHVFSVDAGEKPREAPRDKDALVADAKVLLPNNSILNTVNVAKLGGKQMTVGVAGNRYFHPFIWEKPYYFQFTYDAAGRLASARQLGDSSPVLAEFTWNDLRLSSVRVYGLVDGRKGALQHERILQYKGDQLISEEFRGGKIKYTWSNSGTLVSADCDKDTLDNRSRVVHFLAPGTAGGRVKK